MSELASGTPCYLVHVTGEFKSLAGRVVEVVDSYPTPDGEAGSWYLARAAWVDEMFQGSDLIAPRRKLQPIVPPQALELVTE